VRTADLQDLCEEVAARCAEGSLARLSRVLGEDVQRGDVLCARSSGEGWAGRAVVLSAQIWRGDATHPARLLSCDLMWLNTRKVTTGCALSLDDEFEVERPFIDPLIEAARSSLSAYCRRRGL
jgi:galactokinase